MSNYTCLPPGSLPEAASLPIKPSLDFVYVNGNNMTDSAMARCCNTKPVSIIYGCYELCELDSSYTGMGLSKADILNSFSSCLSNEQRQTVAIAANINSAAPGGISLSCKGAVLALVVASTLF